MAKKKDAGKGIRYTAEQREEILQFLNDFNKANGQGGLKAASAKYGVSTVSISRWQGPAKKRRKGAKRGPKKKTTTAATQAVAPKAAGVRASAGKSPVAALHRMVAIQDQIDGLRAEYNSLKTSI